SFVQQAQASLDRGVLTGLAENRVAFAARGDVAAAAAGILIGDGHAGAIYNATGPERLSGAERAALIAEITGRPIAFLVIREEQLRAGLTQAGLPAEVVNIVSSIQASFAVGAFDIVTGDVERLGGRPPRSEEHTSELQSRFDLVCRLLLEKKKSLHPNNPLC